MNLFLVCLINYLGVLGAHKSMKQFLNNEFAVYGFLLGAFFLEENATLISSFVVLFNPIKYVWKQVRVMIDQILRKQTHASRNDVGVFLNAITKLSFLVTVF